MPTIVVIGTQWGDEGKGKIVDHLAEKADVVVRYQGGNNAGHTVVVANTVHKLHLLPSGILYPGCLCLIGNDVVIDPAVLLQEIQTMRERGIDSSNLRISNRAHLIMPYHRLFDRLEETRKGEHKVGTTGRGIGPCYQDKAARTGIRMVSLLDPDTFAEELRQTLEYKNAILTAVFGEKPLSFTEIYQEYLGYAEKLRPYVLDTGYLLNERIAAGQKVLFEGAQATMLDLAHGTYPFVTSSNPTAAAAAVGSGIGPKCLDKIIGVVKAYTTRVGEGPFPTELLNETGDLIREIGHEYGTTTGRPRRCGWLDACVLRYARQINGLDCLAITRLDILDRLPEIKLCVAYRWQGRELTEFPASLKTLSEVEPVYETMPGWQCDTTAARSYAALPPNCQRYLDKIAAVSACRLGVVSVGPGREQTIILEDMF
ncbi:MAG: adenylosuccinate synthase [Oligosphaeraceae bacterium]|nr:adenylosuccinate synthase [Oligosphaeraceae bacterium]